VSMDSAAADAFIERHTLIEAPPLTPEIRLHLATEITPIWQASEAELAGAEVPPPFWAFAWAGGQALARHILDHPDLVAGKRVLDFGAGSGLVAIAAALSSARTVRAAEIDAIACAAIARNARLNNAEITILDEDVIGLDPAADIVLVGDMCYEKPLAERLVRWLRREAAKGVLVLLGDPGRTYRPAEGLEALAHYDVPTSLELEDRTVREGVVSRLLP
jgi:predicted nicotinamide N-methyase